MFQPPLPTLGFPTQHAAIVALYEQGIAPSIIAARIGTTINAVTRSIHRHQQRTGLIVPVKEPVAKGRKGRRFQHVNRNDWRMLNYVRSVQGARAALEAIGQ